MFSKTVESLLSSQKDLNSLGSTNRSCLFVAYSLWNAFLSLAEIVLPEYCVESLEFFKLRTKGVSENIPRFSGLFCSAID